MSFGGFNDNNSQPMADINTTPLVDVMLVLLVIFIITAPLFNEAVPIDLPQTSASRIEEKPTVLRVSLDKEGLLSVDNVPIAIEAFEARCREILASNPKAEMHLRAERTTLYEQVAKIMALAQKAGVEKIAFVTNPG
ncbi:MAG: biopolymer transporter ExbD [Alphaproteobacteria bacterium]|nr:biopolymer transporter ExbD [Alphaproteobacteria bacterium]